MIFYLKENHRVKVWQRDHSTPQNEMPVLRYTLQKRVRFMRIPFWKTLRTIVDASGCNAHIGASKIANKLLNV